MWGRAGREPAEVPWQPGVLSISAPDGEPTTGKKLTGPRDIIQIKVT